MDILNEDISLNEIADIREQYIREQNSGNVDPKTQFTYASNLCRSKNPEALNLALTLLEDFRSKTWKKEAIHESLYYTSIANAKLKNYEEAMEYADILLVNEPNNRKFQELQEQIKLYLNKGLWPYLMTDEISWFQKELLENKIQNLVEKLKEL